MLIRRKLPESHLSDESKGVVSMGVVGTLTALVLSLLIATASGTFNTRNQEITVIIAAKVIQLDRLLQRYGPETDSLRDFRRDEELVPDVNVGSLATTVVTAKLASDPGNIPFYCRFLAKSAQNTRVGPTAEVQVR